MNQITNDLYYIGVDDHQIDLFEGQYNVPYGISYNSYLIKDEKIAILDTVDIHFKEQWLNNIQQILENQKPDYLIIQHMEPDHSANIINFLEVYPNTTIVGNQKTFKMIEQFFDKKLENILVVNENDYLSLGKHQLKFIFASMVHWPEVMITYDEYNQSLFTADGFGKFGALDINDNWDDEARRYYIGIVGKYGIPVQNLLKKIANLKISMICPLHGPVLSNNLEHYLQLYNIWSNYEYEKKGVLICYSSIYGNTKKACEKLKINLNNLGLNNVVIYDLARTDISFVVSEAFKYSHLVLASPTYNGDIFPNMKNFLHHLIERNYSNRTIAFIENGTWAPVATKVMKTMLINAKNISYLPLEIKILSAISKENIEEIALLSKQIIENINE